MKKHNLLMAAVLVGMTIFSLSYAAMSKEISKPKGATGASSAAVFKAKSNPDKRRSVFFMAKSAIETTNAPQAIGTYSQAVRIGNTVYLSGQIPLEPARMELVDGDMRAQITQVFCNLSAVVKAAGGSFSDVVKLNIYLVDLTHFKLLNDIMSDYFVAPYPARVVVEVAGLPKGAQVEIDAIMQINDPSAHI